MNINFLPRTNCKICNDNLSHLFSLSNFPIKLTCDIEPKFGEMELSYGTCDNCNYIQLDKLVPLEILYSLSHNYTSVGNTWKKFFDYFVNLITSHIFNKNVLEIGCPSGKLALQSTDFKKWFIVEPNKKCGIEFPQNITFIECFFDDSFEIKEDIDVIVNSHLFEHIYEPRSFLKKCHSILNKHGKMIFAIPNMEHISQEKLAPFNGVFFEHTIYYNEENVSYLLKIAGFKNIQVYRFETHSLLFYCEKNEFVDNIIIEPPPPKLSKNEIITFNKGIDYYETFSNNCIDFYKNNKNIPIYIFGCSYNSLFLWYLLKNKNIKIHGFFDNNIEKQGKYLFGTNLMIYSPSIINTFENICILLKNGYYSNEIREQLYTIKSDIFILE